MIPFDNQLCWINYVEASSFVTPRTRECLWFYRGVSVIDAGRELKFINVTRHDGLGLQPLKRGTGFTVTCYTLKFEERNKHQSQRAMEWKEDYKITSDELWSLNTPECLPRNVLMFPQVNIDKPHEGLKTEDADLTYAKSELPVLPAEFSKFISMSRKRKNME
ncbi:hypothetical protein E2562_024491 [Oryza meyeriana var. granulata]|uniref:DUF1618 domain-containing protein n=1 Tax=Oryza meyeriana var. granulata TaxID=110450 RepID=A0A6G1BM53_9ORYZ|nr:hypothetical protein E2562_024491 [Oryza meyeriana var. granulata]